MARFNASEINQIESIWRDLPHEHMWSGWAAIDAEPEAIWLYRQRQNWRRFTLTKQARAYVLKDEKGQQIGKSTSLPTVLCDLEIAPALGQEAS